MVRDNSFGGKASYALTKRHVFLARLGEGHQLKPDSPFSKYHLAPQPLAQRLEGLVRAQNQRLNHLLAAGHAPTRRAEDAVVLAVLLVLVTVVVQPVTQLLDAGDQVDPWISSTSFFWSTREVFIRTVLTIG